MRDVGYRQIEVIENYLYLPNGDVPMGIDVVSLSHMS
jgi:hypothetical protein